MNENFLKDKEDILKTGYYNPCMVKPTMATLMDCLTYCFEENFEQDKEVVCSAEFRINVLKSLLSNDFYYLGTRITITVAENLYNDIFIYSGKKPVALIEMTNDYRKENTG